MVFTVEAEKLFEDCYHENTGKNNNFGGGVYPMIMSNNSKDRVSKDCLNGEIFLLINLRDAHNRQINSTSRIIALSRILMMRIFK